ncbi:glutamine synthetase [Candidatus Peregrinibacteria bacterium]|nr:glutamine synthetase [Candidatus Peregrinibacteria bacterium]MBT7736905.1 glutamine synthetase [Candidatus Peregrinibacteria bacterium]
MSGIADSKSPVGGKIAWKLPHLLDLTYLELEEKNLEVKSERLRGATSDEMKGRLISYLEEEKGVKAVMLCFTDLEGKLHALDYDKKFILGAEDNLTFDGSSIRGFTVQSESDLRLKIDWTSFRWLPSDLFGCGKVMVFANVCDQDGAYYHTDFRSQLKGLTEELHENGVTVNVAPEVEGFIFKGVKAEQEFDEKKGFELATMSGYFNSLPQDTLRIFIDKFAEVQRSMGFENEKDHPEVAPAQFELNFKYSLALDTADQILLYKLLARQIAASMGLTASFLPKPIQELNGSGMHTNISLSKDGKNIFFDNHDDKNLSEDAYRFLYGILTYAKDMCLLMNPSVNSYRRLDPHYEAPNEIKVSSVDRGSMVRIPIGNEKSARVEVRTVAPDVNPYLCIYALIKAGLKGMGFSDAEYSDAKNSYNDGSEKLPGDMHTAINEFKKSEFLKDIMGEEDHGKYVYLKEMTADRAPRELGHRVKAEEILYHHEITNQMIWADF